MPTTVDLTGRVFGKLTVLGLSHTEARKDKPNAVLRFWLCRCAGGESIPNRGQDLASGRIISCRCVQRQQVAARMRTHGDTGSPEHRAWKEMLRRCRNKHCRNYPNYGARGTKLCSRWTAPATGFANFLADMGRMPAQNMQLDRKRNNGHYTPANCRWATRKQQCRNKRNNRRITYNGVTLTVAEWAEKTGPPDGTLRDRLKRWSVEKSLTTPLQRQGHRP